MKPHETSRVAIVGAGFTGSLTAAHLLRNAARPFEVCLIERHPPFGPGTAFKAPLPCHLLNVPAVRMSAYPDGPEHLMKWLTERASGPDPGFEVDSGGLDAAFLPRRLYGEYVEHTLSEAAERSRARLTRIVGEAVSIDPDASGAHPRIRMRDGSTIAADCAVLALGNFPPMDPLGNGAAVAAGRYAADPWDEEALEGLDSQSTVLTIGSNLTMVDIALTLDHRGHRGPIVAVSTHGLLPQPHRKNLLPPWSSRVEGRTGRPRELLRAIREDVTLASADGVDWRSVVDAIRPKIVSIWSSWPERERARFLRHARAYWEVHRHRMAPENARTIASLVEGARLRVVAGRIAGMSETRDAIEVRVKRRGAAGVETIRAARVVNCTGPGTDMRRTRDSLVQDLLARRLARPGPLGLGFDTDRDGALMGADGRPSVSLFTLGPLLKGRDWETTAIPEIRMQTEALALCLARRFVTPGAHGGSS